LPSVKYVCLFTAIGQLVVADFEKDDDSNGHIDFITAASVRLYNNTPIILVH